jgi:hypothetical protein
VKRARRAADDTVIDGELVAFDEIGKPSSTLLARLSIVEGANL